MERSPLTGPDARYRVSAIVSTYSSEAYMAGCLRDLLDQTLYARGELEIVVIDSCSPQDEGRIVREFMRTHPHIVYVRTTGRETLYAAWNRGAALSRGRYLTNANTDDRHRPDALEVLADALDRRPGVGLAYGDCLITELEVGDFDPDRATSAYNFPECSPRQALARQFFGPQPMWRRSLHERLGGFRPELVVQGDYDFFIRAVLDSGGLHIPRYLGVYCRRPDSVERSNRLRNAVEQRQVQTYYRQSVDIGQVYRRLKEYPDDPEAALACLLDLGNLYLAAGGDVDSARPRYLRAKALWPDHPAPEHNLRICDALEDYFRQTGRCGPGARAVPRDVLDALAGVAHPAVSAEPAVCVGSLEHGLEESRAIQATQLGQGGVSSGADQDLTAILAERLGRAGWADRLERYAGLLTAVRRTDRPDAGPVAADVIVVAHAPGPLSVENLALLLRQRGPRFRIIFVDNGTNDDYARSLAAMSDVAVSLRTNTGANVSRNIGSLFAEAPVLIFLDDDARPAPDLIAAHVEELERHKALLLRGVVRPRTDSPLNRLAGHYDLGPVAYPRFCDIEGNMSARAVAFFRVGGWDDNLGYGHDGIDLSVRLLNHCRDPRRLLYSPRPVIFHDYARNDRHLAVKRENHARAWAYLRDKLPGIDGFIRSWDGFKPGAAPEVRPSGSRSDQTAGRPTGEGRSASLRNLAEHYRRKGQLDKATAYLAQAQDLETAERTAGPTTATATAAPQGQGQPEPIPVRAATPESGPDRGRENEPLAHAGVALFNAGEDERLLALATAHPQERALARMASAVLLRQGRLDAANPSPYVLAALPEDERRLKLRTAGLLSAINAPLAVEPRVHLLILTHNRAELIPQAFRELAATDYRNLAVYVADNGSDDGSDQAAQKALELFAPGVARHFVRFPVNIGRPAGHDWLLTAFDHSAAEFIAIGDDDLTDVPPDWLRRMINTARLFADCAVVGGKALNPGSPKIIHGGVRRLLEFTEDGLSMTNEAQDLDVGQHDHLDLVDHVIGCLHIYNRQWLERAGLFDIRFSPCQMVDIEHHLRLRLAGARIVYNGLIEFRHARALGRRYGKERASTGNALGNLLKLLHKYDPAEVNALIVRGREDRRRWLAGSGAD